MPKQKSTTERELEKLRDLSASPPLWQRLRSGARRALRNILPNQDDTSDSAQMISGEKLPTTTEIPKNKPVTVPGTQSRVKFASDVVPEPTSRSAVSPAEQTPIRPAASSACQMPADTPATTRRRRNADLDVIEQGRDWLENRQPPFDDESRVERVTRSAKKKTPAAPKPPPKPKGRLMTKTPVKTKICRCLEFLGQKELVRSVWM